MTTSINQPHNQSINQPTDQPTHPATHPPNPPNPLIHPFLAHTSSAPPQPRPIRLGPTHNPNHPNQPNPTSSAPSRPNPPHPCVLMQSCVYWGNMRQDPLCTSKALTRKKCFQVQVGFCLEICVWRVKQDKTSIDSVLMYSDIIMWS